MAKKTTGTTWAIPMSADGKPALQAFRGTFLTDSGFEMARGARPDFDPATAVYLTSDMVANIAAQASIRIDGDVCSGRRLLEAATLHAWKETMTLQELKDHKHLGKTMPSVESILKAYAARHAADDLEA